MSSEGYVHIEVEEILKETDAAFLIRLEDGSQCWIPKSQISDPDNYDEGDRRCSMSITEFIAEKKGL